MKIKIGADELILWIRKNDIAKTIPNDEIHGLGVMICRIIEELGGKKIEDNHPCYWPLLLNDPAIDKFRLPQTAAQYEIDTTMLPMIYEQLVKL